MTKRRFRHLKFALFGHDVGRDGVGHSALLEMIHGLDVPVFMYPHAARPMVIWDGMYPVWPHTRAFFAIAEGHAEVMQRFGYPIPIEVTGWALCEMKPFTPVDRVQNILFGPIHPNMNGKLPIPDDRWINQEAYRVLLDYCSRTGVHLTVRHIHGLANNGLYPVEGVTYIQGNADSSFTDIDNADLVVGHQTFAYIAVARGRPTLMMGEDRPPRSGNHEWNIKYVSSWDKYKDLVMYPLDILRNDVDALIQRATTSDEDIKEWKRLMIGNPFDPRLFVDRLESYL